MFRGSHHPMHRKKKLFLIPVIILLFAGLAAAIQHLWNYVLPETVNARPITYWQAGALLVLCRMLFGRFHFGGRGHEGGFGHKAREMRDRWMNMTDEERAVFKQRFKDKCGKGGRWTDNDL